MKKLLGTLLVAASLCLSGCSNETDLSKHLKVKEICSGYTNTYNNSWEYCLGKEKYNSAAGLNGNGINPSRIKHIDTVVVSNTDRYIPGHAHIVVYYYE